MYPLTIGFERKIAKNSTNPNTKQFPTCHSICLREIHNSICYFKPKLNNSISDYQKVWDGNSWFERYTNLENQSAKDVKDHFMTITHYLQMVLTMQKVAYWIMDIYSEKSKCKSFILKIGILIIDVIVELYICIIE